LEGIVKICLLGHFPSGYKASSPTLLERRWEGPTIRLDDVKKCCPFWDSISYTPVIKPVAFHLTQGGTPILKASANIIDKRGNTLLDFPRDLTRRRKRRKRRERRILTHPHCG
jgi:hypothetical protein